MPEQEATQVAETQETVQKEQSYQDWKAEREGKTTTSVAEVEAESAAESETAKPEKEDVPDKPKGKGGFQDRINQLTREKREAQEERDRLREELKQRGEKPEAKQAVEKAKPKLEDFASHEEFVEALTDWKLDQRAQKAEQDRVQATQQETLKKTFDAYNAQLPAARESHPDFDEVVGNESLKIPQSAQLAIIESETGAEIAYYLGKHPEICEELANLSDVKVVARIGRIEALLEKSEASEITEDKKPETKVPPPIKPVGGSSARSTVDPDNLPYAEFKKWREKNGARR